MATRSSRLTFNAMFQGNAKYKWIGGIQKPIIIGYVSLICNRARAKLTTRRRKRREIEIIEV